MRIYNLIPSAAASCSKISSGETSQTAVFSGALSITSWGERGVTPRSWLKFFMMLEADKEDFEHSLRVDVLGRLKSLHAKGIPSRLASYMEGEFSGI